MNDEEYPKFLIKKIVKIQSNRNSCYIFLGLTFFRKVDVRTDKQLLGSEMAIIEVNQSSRVIWGTQLA